MFLYAYLLLSTSRVCKQSLRCLITFSYIFGHQTEMWFHLKFNSEKCVCPEYWIKCYIIHIYIAPAVPIIKIKMVAVTKVKCIICTRRLPFQNSVRVARCSKILLAKIGRYYQRSKLDGKMTHIWTREEENKLKAIYFNPSCTDNGVFRKN